MNNQHILEQAIQRAITNGWNVWHGKYIELNHDIITGELYCIFNDAPDDTEPLLYKISLFAVIFDHSFARAIWGESEVGLFENDKWYDLPVENDSMFPITIIGNWQYHLQQMVVSPDPIKYLSENI